MSVTPAEARQIAHEAYIYGYPIVDNLRVQYSYFVDRAGPDYKAPYNQLCNIPRVYTWEDKAIQTPNSDTPYSWIGLDLRAEPIVLTVPAIAKNRYWSLQLIDLYTFNFDYLGTRTTGNDGGSPPPSPSGASVDRETGAESVGRSLLAAGSSRLRPGSPEPS